MAADRLQQYGAWLKSNVDKKGTPEFEKVASAYKQLRLQGDSKQPPKPEETKPAVEEVTPARVNVAAEEEPKFGAMSAFKALSALPDFVKAQMMAGAERGAKTAGGAIAGAATIPETLGVGERGATEAAMRYFTGAEPGDVYFGAGKLGSEIAGTAGVGNVLAVPFKAASMVQSGAAPVLNALARSFKTGGFAQPELPSVMGRLATRAVGGGTVGGTTAALLGEDPGMATAIGAGLPVVGQAVGAGVAKGRDILSPEKVTLLEAAGDDMDKLIDRLKNNEVLIPGAAPHAGEVAADVGSPGFSRLVASVLETQTQRKSPVDKKIADMMVQNAVARAQQYQAAFGSAEAAEAAIMQGLVPPPGVASDDVLAQLNNVAAERLQRAKGAIESVAGRKMAEATAAEQQQLAGLQAAREQELGRVGATQQATAAQLQTQQQQQMAALAAEQEAARGAALGRREQRVNQLMAEQEAAKNALMRPVEPPAPPAELGALEQQRAALETARGKVGAELPKVSQMEAGKPIVERADILAKQAQKEIVDPAYKKAFASHKGKIDLSQVVDRAKSKSPLGSLNFSGFPKLEEKIDSYEIALQQFNAGERRVAPRLNLSLSEANDLGKVVGSKIRQLQEQTTGGNVNIIESNLLSVKRDLEKVVDKTTSKETKKLLGEARNLARTAKIEPYDEGIAGLMRQETSLGRERLLPEKVATEVLSKEQSAAEFVRAFGKDPESVDNLRTAIQDLYRRDVVEPKGVYDPEAHNRFMRKYGDKLDILDNAGLGVRDTLEEQAYTASRLESELGKVSGKIEGLNKVQQQQLDMLKQQQAQALQDLTKGQKAALGAVKEEEGRLFGQLSREQKATLGATEKQQRQAFAELNAKQKEELTGIKQKFAAEETAVTKKGKAERQFVEQQRKDMAKKAHRKYSSILGYQNVEQMRSKMLSTPAKFTEALPYMNDESKRRLASDIVSDVVGKGGDIEKAFSNNQSSLTKILDAAYPGQGKQLVDTLIERGKALNNIREIGKESILRPTQPLRMESPEIQDIVKNRRKQFSSAEQSDIEALIKDAKRAKTFEDLANIGSSDADRAATKILEENTGGTNPVAARLQAFATYFNDASRRLRVIEDEKIRNKLALAALDPKVMAQVLEDAKAYEQAGKRAGEIFRATGSAAAKAVPVMTNDNRNALAR
jgi:hypothetical protein